MKEKVVYKIVTKWSYKCHFSIIYPVGFQKLVSPNSGKARLSNDVVQQCLVMFILVWTDLMVLILHDHILCSKVVLSFSW